MKQTICYLYEYENKKQTKNVGFLKCMFQKDKIIFQIHGKGLECDKSMDLELFLFAADGAVCTVDRAGTVEGVQGMVNYRVTVENLNSSSMNKYDGILLQSAHEKWYTATWKQKPMVWERIVREDAREEADHLEDACEEEVCAEHVREERACEETACEEDACVEEVCADEACEDVYEEEVQVKEAMTENIEHCVAADYHEPEEMGTECPDGEIRTYDKIDRHGIAKLPQREWKLAHNNFLLHGYKNYKHLMLIRHHGRLFLGVPGIYHKKEEAAAKSFGFPLFHELDEQYKGLEAAEYEKREGFGYWCRPVTERRGIE